METQQAFTKADCLPNGQLLSVAILKITGLPPRGPAHNFFVMRGGLTDFFGSTIFAKCDFLGHKKNRGIFWVMKKGLRDYFGCARKSSDFFG